MPRDGAATLPRDVRVSPRQYVQLLVRQPPPGLPVTARAVAHVIATFADFDTGDNAYPSQTTIARAAGISRRSAIDQVNALVAAGWLCRTRPTVEAARRHQTTRYALAVPDELVRAVAPELVRAVALGSASGRTRTGEPDDTSLVRGVAHNQVKDPRARRGRARDIERCIHGKPASPAVDGSLNCADCIEAQDAQ